jgi:predicted MFS family arabinose efflux permease
MRVPPHPERERGGSVARELADGLAYVRDHRIVRAVLLLLMASATLGGGYVGLLPAVAQGTLHGGPHALGLLLGASGAGALTSALYLAGRSDVAGLERVIGRCALSLGLALCAFEAITNVWIAMPVMFVLGASLIMQAAATNTLLQAIVDPLRIGRVMSLYAMVFFAGAPLGALLVGALARSIGPTQAFAAAGVVCVACALLFRRFRRRLSSHHPPLDLRHKSPQPAPAQQPHPHP